MRLLVEIDRDVCGRDAWPICHAHYRTTQDTFRCEIDMSCLCGEMPADLICHAHCNRRLTQDTFRCEIDMRCLCGEMPADLICHAHCDS
ncbi:hypothetical protein J6590_014226 [Homalodisca vitripennis]|nr:hypothetical protein J6590_014226 [Homalodisca vitripennis]